MMAPPAVKRQHSGFDMTISAPDTSAPFRPPESDEFECFSREFDLRSGTTAAAPGQAGQPQRRAESRFTPTALLPTEFSLGLDSNDAPFR